MPYGVDSQALTITVSSSRAATGRWPSLKRRVKKSFQEAKPQYSSAGSCSNCSIPTARWAASHFQPDGESFSTYSESELSRKSHQAVRIFLSIALIRGSRNAANPAGVPIVQSRIAPSGVATMFSPNSGAIVSTSLIKRSICGTLSRWHRQVVDLVWWQRGLVVVAIAARYKGYRYPIEVIGHAVWLYHRFALSLRDVEELMLARGVVVTYETIRSWCAKFGPDYAAQLRRRRPRPGDKWHLDEVFVKINGATYYLWRAVDQHGDVLDMLVQSRRNAVAAKRFFRKLLKGLRYVPRVLVTDKLASYQVAHREVLPSVTHRRSKYLNNRAENSHQPTRVRERVMKRFASPGQAQRFLFAFSHIRQHFRPRRHLISAPEWRTEMTNRFAVWDEITVAAAA